jgi:hypothetical protein
MKKSFVRPQATQASGGRLQIAQPAACLALDYPTMSIGRIISLSSCSRMWQCQTYL